MEIEEMKPFVAKALENNFTKEYVKITDNACFQYFDGEDVFKSGVALFVDGKEHTKFIFGNYAENMADLLYYDDIVEQIALSTLLILHL